MQLQDYISHDAACIPYNAALLLQFRTKSFQWDELMQVQTFFIPSVFFSAVEHFEF